MIAALQASDETVSSLLSWGAGPDKTDANGRTALICAIGSKCVTSINLLASVTKANLGGALYQLARDKIELTTGELRKLVERAAQGREAAIEGLEAAAKFGSINMIEILADYTEDHSIFEAKKEDIWKESIASDNEESISALLHLLPNPPLEAITLARERGVPGVVRLLLPDTKVEGGKEREALKDAVLANTAQLWDQVPRDLEFTYNQNMEKLGPLIRENCLVQYTTLLKHLHLHKAHVDDKEPIETCPPDCSQKQSCQRIRETLGLVNIIKNKLGERSKVFEGIEMSLIGSTREGSRAFYNDEVEASKQKYWWINPVNSDSEATVSALLHFLPNPPLEAITLARERGVPGVVRLLLPDTKIEGEEERETLRNAVLANTAQLWDQVPRDVEFTYNQNMEKLAPLIRENCLVQYTTLLKHLHLHKAHVDDKEPIETCPPDCSQKQSCQRIRETLGLVNIIKNKLGERSKVFEGIEMSMIGSTREGSRAFYNDEVDIHLSLNNDLKQFCFFDVKEQALKRRDPSKDKMPDDIAKYFDDRGIFKTEKYFFDFVASVHSIISTLTLPSDFRMLPVSTVFKQPKKFFHNFVSHIRSSFPNSFSMLPLTTPFNPCTKCMTLGLKGLQVMRCRHKTDCEQHKRCGCEEPSKCECLEECGCREYTSPSLTWSKVGVVLHLQWREEDGTLFTIDCDLNCPTWPTHTRYDGNRNDASGYLMRERPVGWLEELSKLENMINASSLPHLVNSKSWPVKFRLINRDTVLPSQVTTLTPPLSSPDSSLHERCNTEGEEIGRVCAPESFEILHWQLRQKLSA